MLIVTPYIKLVVWAMFLLSGVGLLLLYLLPSTALPPGKLDKPVPSGDVMQLAGVVKGFDSNRSGDIDKLLLSNREGNTWMHFPPHTARRVMQLATKGRQVTVQVQSRPPHGPAGGENRYQLAQLQADDAVLFINDIPSPPPASGQPVELSGKVDEWVRGKHEEITGFIVEDCIVVLPPHLAQSITPLLQQGRLVVIKGYERSEKDGFVNKDNRKLVKPYRLTIDGTDYLL